MVILFSSRLSRGHEQPIGVGRLADDAGGAALLPDFFAVKLDMEFGAADAGKAVVPPGPVGRAERFKEQKHLGIGAVGQDKSGPIHNLLRWVRIAVDRLDEQADLEAAVVGVPKFVAREAAGEFLQLPQASGRLYGRGGRWRHSMAKAAS